ncbi:hypothetical protein RD792_001982 [Penstemon davidsonii]|uniref:Kinetochore protein Nuf2 N-terminal domain-containing protein n=1 Tax=Penstemon davidsonii TaxID=160366 RepID=A0ABR0DR14_9LAMI|nr:hypothetical protein RD792_001982 [Penstemon davidsonii]
MSKYDYPRLSLHDIIKVLSACNMATVSEADLLRPDPEFICNLYNQILRHMGFKEDHELMEFEALDQLDNPDSHVHSVPLMNLCNKVQQLLGFLHCPKAFTPMDLMKPDPDRTEIFLSALLNFHVYRESKLNELKPIRDELELLEERKLVAQDRISQLNSEITEHEELRETELPLVQELQTQVNELNQRVTDLNKHQVRLKTSFKQLKEKDTEMNEKISDAEFALVQSVQENANLRSKIVQSPDKLQRALEEKKRILIDAKNAERAAVKSFQDKTATLETYDKACKKVSKNIAQMQAIQEQVNQSKAVEKEVKVLKNKLSDDGVLDKSLEAKIVELQSEVDPLKKLKKQLEKETAQHHEEVTREVNNVKLEVESKKHDLQLRQKRVESVLAEVDVINSKIRIVKEEGEAKMQKLCCKSEEIVAEVKSDVMFIVSFNAWLLK